MKWFKRKPKYRILEKYSSYGEPYYIVQHRVFFVWENLWPDYNWSYDGWTSWDRTFSTREEAEKALAMYFKSIRRPKVVKTIEVGD